MSNFQQGPQDLFAEVEPAEAMKVCFVPDFVFSTQLHWNTRSSKFLLTYLS